MITCCVHVIEVFGVSLLVPSLIGMKRERSVEVTCGNSSTKRYLSAQQVERIRLNKEEALARLNKKYATVLGHENRAGGHVI